MNSETTLVARQYRLQEWANQIHDCKNRPNDMTVKQWCDQHGITTANYYYRLTEVRKACLANIPAVSVQNVVPVPAELITSNPVTVSALDITVHNMKIHVNSDTTPELLKMVLEVASDVK